jgi:hypothetical protein
MKTTILRQLIVLPLLVSAMAMLHACGAAKGASRAAPASFTTQYVLRQGASVVISPAVAGAAAGIATVPAPVVRLERINDSRCRAGAVCVWAGYISFSFVLQQPDGSVSNFVLSEDMPNGTAKASRNGLYFTLAGFEPQQVPAKNEEMPDYRVSLKVSNINSP